MEDNPTLTNPYKIVRLGAVSNSPSYPKIKYMKSGGWVAYGEKNIFPQDVLAMSGRSPVNSSIIQSTVTYVCGKGVKDTAAGAGKYVGTPNNVDTWDDVIERIAVDYKTFGGFYWQVIVNRGSTTVSLFHQDFSTVRVGEIDDNGDPKTFKISNDWTKTSGREKPVELDVWPGSVAKAKKGQAYMFHFWDYAPGLTHYCTPNWWAAQDYVRADGKLGPFYNNSIDNNFTPSVIVTMPSNPAQPVKDEFQEQMEGAFTGVENGNAVVTLWGESSTVLPTVTPFNASNNADVYINVESQVFQKIISAHRLSSPTLAGVSGSGNLSGNAAEIIDSYVLYNYTVVEKMRRKILDQLNVFTMINRTAALQIDELDVIAKIRESSAGNESILTINDGTGKANAADVESLASKLGVGGTQALTEIMAGQLPDDQKRGLLGVLFGLTEDDIDKLFNKTSTKLAKLLKKLAPWK